jgi:ferredoxin
LRVSHTGDGNHNFSEIAPHIPETIAFQISSHRTGNHSFLKRGEKEMKYSYVKETYMETGVKAHEKCNQFATCSTCRFALWATDTEGYPADAEMEQYCVRVKQDK